MSQSCIESDVAQIRAYRKYVQSYGIFGPSSLLLPIYSGTSEIIQAFCRSCAVFGGTYMLQFDINQVVMKDGLFNSIVDRHGQTHYGKHLFTSGVEKINSGFLLVLILS